MFTKEPLWVFAIALQYGTAQYSTVHYSTTAYQGYKTKIIKDVCCVLYDACRANNCGTIENAFDLKFDPERLNIMRFIIYFCTFGGPQGSQLKT